MNEHYRLLDETANIKRNFEAILQATRISSAKRNGNMGVYELELFKFASTYSELFCYPGAMDCSLHGETIKALAEILPEFFRNDVLPEMGI